MHDDMTVRDLVPDDAVSLVELFRSCYGDSYGTALFYDASALRVAIEQRTLRSVAILLGDQLVGHMGITIRHPGAMVCETGNTVVHPAARGRGLLMMLAIALQKRVQREGFVGYVHFPTTAHAIMQKASVARDGKETGVMLAYVAADTAYEAIERKPGRLAATVVYQPIAPMPSRSVYLPSRYRDVIQDLYDGLGFQRTQHTNPGVALCSAPAQVESQYNNRRSSLHLYVRKAGGDVAAAVRDRIQRKQPVVSYLDLPLDDPEIDDTVEALRNEGFRYCALLPEFAHTDVLRLQALHKADPEDFQPTLVNEEAQRLCAYIRDDTPLPTGKD